MKKLTRTIKKYLFKNAKLIVLNFFTEDKLEGKKKHYSLKESVS